MLFAAAGIEQRKERVQPFYRRVLGGIEKELTQEAGGQDGHVREEGAGELLLHCRCCTVHIHLRMDVDCCLVTERSQPYALCPMLHVN